MSRPKKQPGAAVAAYRQILPAEFDAIFARVATHGQLSAAVRAVFADDTRPVASALHAISRDVLLQHRLDDARRAHRDRLLLELQRRGIEGVQKAVRYQGAIVGYETEYSDAALIGALRHYLPDWTDKKSVADITTHGATEDSDTVFSLSYELAEAMPPHLRAQLIPVLRWVREQRLQIVGEEEPAALEAPAADDYDMAQLDEINQ